MATHLHRQSALWVQQQNDAMGRLLELFRDVCAHGGADTLIEVAESVRDLEELRPELADMVDMLPHDWREKVAEVQHNMDAAIAAAAKAETAAPAPAPITSAAVADFLKNLSPEQAGELKVLMAGADTPGAQPGAGDGAPGGGAPAGDPGA